MTEDRESQLNPASLRKRVGLTQRQVAQVLNVRESTVSEWERGISAPRLRLVRQMLKVYQCSLDELIDAFEPEIADSPNPGDAVENVDVEVSVMPLKAIREEIGMTQVQFAIALDIDPSTISRCERGLSEPVFTLFQVKRLCQLTGKTLDELPDYLGRESSEMTVVLD